MSQLTGRTGDFLLERNHPKIADSAPADFLGHECAVEAEFNRSFSSPIQQIALHDRVTVSRDIIFPREQLSFYETPERGA